MPVFASAFQNLFHVEDYTLRTGEKFKEKNKYRTRGKAWTYCIAPVTKYKDKTFLFSNPELLTWYVKASVYFSMEPDYDWQQSSVSI